MNILQLIEQGAGIAAPFVPPPYGQILNIVAGFANNTHATATAQGVTLPNLDLSALESILPKDLLGNLIAGKTVTLTVTIDGSKLTAAVQALGNANQALADLKSAFTIK